MNVVRQLEDAKVFICLKKKNQSHRPTVVRTIVWYLHLKLKKVL